MRLTLRTLLAYLDNTLEPQDAEVLRQKLAESGFATQLVQRLRAGLVNPALTALRPDAVGPNEDANAIGEYLDSTLPTEQVAEIERACLESDSRLAEAAACHQILTMVLGKTADVPPALRNRIYELPEREIERIASSSSRFSSLSIDDPPPVVHDIFDAPTMDSPLTHSGGPVTPVGPSDTGVSDAPTRIRESGVIADAAAGKGKTPAIAGSKKRDRTDTAIYGGSIRTSRIAPWLVSLALAGVLLFAMTRLFAPLLNRGTEVADLVDSDLVNRDLVDRDTVSTPDIEVPPDLSPPMVEIEPTTEADDFSDAEMLPPPAAIAEPDLGRPDIIEPETEPDVGVEMTNDGDLDVQVLAPPTPAMADGGLSDPGDEDDTFTEMAPPSPSVAALPPASDASLPPGDGPEPPLASEMTAEVSGENLGVANAAAPEIATITTENTLVATNKGLPGEAPKWVRLKKGMTVVPGYSIVCPPTFRATMTSVSGFDVTLVGPAEVVWVADGTGESALAVISGRLLMKSNKPDVRIDLALGNELVTLSFADIGSVAAASVKHFRAPGYDPKVSENRIELAGVLSVQGSIDLAAEQGEETLNTGLQWVKRGAAAPTTSPVDEVPAWISPVSPTATSLAASAREGLLELIKSDQPLEIALREATLFRRSEVAALAAETLLHMGQGDVYFGNDGILSETKQRAYWPEHFLELVATVDRSAIAAEQLEKSITKMDATNATAIMRLLTGYSQKQLVEGDDETLVNLLDSEAMAVRVLALENLNKITGTTLYFRAEQDNAVRRAPGIKKWVARQRKGDIRWPE
ncbi:hypothetical protein [Rubripirellula reticaptiva]|uniref:Uncharacterized protein n=1 Tax=Rubripirellula reticaptiva TaxID=2528013 RepID=A0A5C6EGQ2_9BACT|nr:hypothetical protein [Rubripirellula reticaptiva]TWU47988.1 hypothetical protein Poly59_48320 [Rubripirellula reticaptiva]